MNKLFYPRLAAQNLRKNSRFYIPYILTVMGSAASFYILGALAGNQDLPNRLRYQYLSMFTFIGLWVVGLFSVIFLFYTNSFLMKRRGRELGLYNILGMDKRNIAAMLFFETLYVAVIGILGGIAVGIVLQKLMTLLIWQLMGITDGASFYRFSISTTALMLTLALFGAILLLTLLFNLRRVHVQKPVELLHSDNAGEREPKSHWLLTVLGILTLGGGYVIAVTTKDAMSALSLYFVAVFLVIIGTYCLFTSVSIAVLKLLRKNKRYYYKTGHFISISGMLYRMKRNAVGLANICVLSTMVLVMVSGTLTLYLGAADAVNIRNPGDITAHIRYTPLSDPCYDSDAIESTARFDGEKTLAHLCDTAERLGVPVTGAKAASSLCFSAKWTGACFQTIGVNDMDSFASPSMLAFIPAKDFTAMTGIDVSLAQNEVMAAGKMPSGLTDTLMIDFRERQTQEPVGVQYYKVAAQIDDFDGLPQYLTYAATVYYFVVPDDAALDELWLLQSKAYLNDAQSDIHWYAYLDTSADDAAVARICGYDESGSQHWQSGQSTLNDPEFAGIGVDSDAGRWDMYSVEARGVQLDETYSMNGGFFFLGIFLGVLFIMATVLIIYYKQLSEGYEDRARFQIMQNVGLQKSEIRRSVNHQLLIVFFAPLLLAAVHVAFDFRLIQMLLTLFQVRNAMLTLWCTLGTFGVFALLYLVVYRLTARAYFRIVR